MLKRFSSKLEHLFHFLFGGPSDPSSDTVSEEIVYSNASIKVYGDEIGNVTDKIVVDFYYEVLCPDSRSFFLYQLYPAWQSMKNILIVNYIPYGKAFVSIISFILYFFSETIFYNYTIPCFYEHLSFVTTHNVSLIC